MQELLSEQVVALAVAEVSHVHFRSYDEVETVLGEVDWQGEPATVFLADVTFASLGRSDAAGGLVSLVRELHLQQWSLK